jgi:hypothetical protein
MFWRSNRRVINVLEEQQKDKIRYQSEDYKTFGDERNLEMKLWRTGALPLAVD